MKKAIVMLCVFMVSIALPLFADDALVLPKGVLRTYITAAYGYGDSEYDKDGEKQDTNELKAVNLGMAIEFGATDWISPGIQWAPGYNVWSTYEQPYVPGQADVNGPYDIKVGAKFQIIGPNAPVQSSSMRFAVVPGVKIPLAGADFEDEAAKAVAGDDFTISDPDRHAWAIGSQASFDYVINEMFYVNLFGEYMKFLERKDVYTNAISTAMGGSKVDLDYGYSLKLEAEPHFEMAFGTSKLGISVPVTYEFTPALKTDGDEDSDGSNYLLSIGPSASFFFLAGPLPLEAKLGYTLPLLGQNESANSTVVFQFKSYLKF